MHFSQHGEVGLLTPHVHAHHPAITGHIRTLWFWLCPNNLANIAVCQGRRPSKCHVDNAHVTKNNMSDDNTKTKSFLLREKGSINEMYSWVLLDVTYSRDVACCIP